MNIFTSEAVFAGHPDKVCDAISDALLDAYIAQDPNSRVAIETSASGNFIHVFGELTTEAEVDVEQVVRDTIREIGYTDIDYGLEYDTCLVMNTINQQSPEISEGVSKSLEARLGDTSERAQLGAGDQGMMFGYATIETPNMMPVPVYLAQQVALFINDLRKKYKWIRPDGKCQISVNYEGREAVSVKAIVISVQHDPDIELEELRSVIRSEVENYLTLLAIELDEEIEWYINPAGTFATGGCVADAGLTGRKIIVDTYGGMARHGGGAFSGKDPSKVDRSGAYAMRWVAKNIIEAGLADEVEVQVAYAIGVAEPVSLSVNTFGTNKVPELDIILAVREHFDLRPEAIIDELNLRTPIYSTTTQYGHFGKYNLLHLWESPNKALSLRDYCYN